MAGAPTYIVFAGVNGAGKSTLYRSGLWVADAAEADLPRVNPDEILVARGWDGADASAQLAVGREAVALVRGYFDAGASFNQETTLSGRSSVRSIKRAKELGYRVLLFYVGVESPELAVDRIAHRVSVGGHHIDAALVARRYDASLRNLLEVAPLCDAIRLYDNSVDMRLVAASCESGFVEVAYGTQRLSWHAGVIEQLKDVLVGT